MPTTQAFYRSLSLLLCIGLLISDLPGFTQKVRAVTNCKIVAQVLQVNESCTLPKRVTPYVVSEVTVAKNTQLSILSGTTLAFTASAEMKVAGGLHIVGTGLSPISFTSSVAGADWQGMTVETEQTIDLEYIRFSGFKEAISLQSPDVHLAHLTFRDGLDNRLVIHSAPAIQNISLQSMHFENYGAGEAMHESGLDIEGEWGRIDLDDTSFIDSRTKNTDYIGIIVNGTFANFDSNAAHFPHNCPALFGEQDQLNHLVHMQYKPEDCQQRSVPIVFVPGYGTSINLPALTKTGSTTASDGWQFLSLLTPSYSRFMQTVKDNNIPLVPAYYDWRLPADQIVKLYLKPAIEKAKQEYGVDAVNIVAHSFGGLVSRSYIQSDAYEGDVEHFIELGTPNYGVTKAYSVWEGGELPEDWKALNVLIRYYQHIDGGHPDASTVVHHDFASAAQMMPLYPAALTRQTTKVDPTTLCQANTWLEALNSQSQLLSQRTNFQIMANDGIDTVASLDIQDPNCHRSSWQDGKINKNSLLPGDGTVPWVGVAIPGVPIQKVAASHNDLPGVAAVTILEALYPFKKVRPFIPNTGLNRTAGDSLSFLFDCPLDVTITAPNGVAYTSAKLLTEDENLETTAEAVDSDDLLWMLLPRLTGIYHIEVTARQDTTMRAWQEDGPVYEKELMAGQSTSWEVDPTLLSQSASDNEATSLPVSTSSTKAFILPNQESLMSEVGAAPFQYVFPTGINLNSLIYLQNWLNIAEKVNQAHQDISDQPFDLLTSVAKKAFVHAAPSQKAKVKEKKSIPWFKIKFISLWFLFQPP